MSSQKSCLTSLTKCQTLAKSCSIKKAGVELQRLVRDRFRTGMDFHSYRLAEQSMYYEEQVANHVAKLVSRS